MGCGAVFGGRRRRRLQLRPTASVSSDAHLSRCALVAADACARFSRLAPFVDALMTRRAARCCSSPLGNTREKEREKDARAAKSYSEKN